MAEEVPTSCVWCGECRSNLLFIRPDLLTLLPGMFRLTRCAGCGLVRLDPRPTTENLLSYYPEGYSTYEPIIATEPSAVRRVDREYGMRKRLRALERLQPGGRLLDVGCGTGIFLSEAIRSGKWDAYGVEPSPAAAGYARRHLGERVWQGPFAQGPFPRASFDAITMWNVLEHMEDPIAELRHAHGLLKPHAVLTISVPNLTSWEARAFGMCWIGWDVPRHLNLFPLALLQQVLAHEGFSLLDRRCIAGSHYTVALSLQNLVNTLPTALRGIGLAGLRVFRSLPVRVAMAPWWWVSDQARASGIVSLFARKEG